MTKPTVMLSVRIQPVLMKTLDIEAKRAKISRSELVVRLLNESMHKSEEK